MTDVAMCSGGSCAAPCVPLHLSRLKDRLSRRLVTGELVRTDGWAYPELGQAQSADPERSLLEETPLFKQTLDRGQSCLIDELKACPPVPNCRGEAAFKL